MCLLQELPESEGEGSDEGAVIEPFGRPGNTCSRHDQRVFVLRPFTITGLPFQMSKYHSSEHTHDVTLGICIDYYRENYVFVC